MIDKNDFNALRAEMQKAEDEREKIIQLSRDVIKESKIVIYAIQRGDKPNLKSITKLVSQLQGHSDTGIERTAIQEYVEAACFYHYIFNKRLPTRAELDVDAESYLMGICDLTGELVRKAVKDVIEKKPQSAVEITKFVEQIYGEFLQFNLRNGELRKKSDAIKWNLQKLEELSLNISMK